MKKGYGSIRFLGEGRRRPYAVHAPAERISEGGRVRYVRRSAICYAPDWFTGFAMLTAWHAGVYHAGMEAEIGQGVREMFGGGRDEIPAEMETMKAYCDQIQGYVMLLSARLAKEEDIFGSRKGMDQKDPEPAGADDGDETQPAAVADTERMITVKEVIDRFYDYKFGPNAVRILSASAAAYTRAIIKKLAPFYDRTLDDLTIDELQQFVNSIRLGRTMVSKTLQMIKELYRYALPRDLCTKNTAEYIRMPDTPDYVHHQDFTDEEIKKLWEHQEDPVIAMILIMCYSGFRVSAYRSLETNLIEGWFFGGVKTKAGKERYVPIHSAIRPLVEAEMKAGLPYAICRNINYFCFRMKRKLQEIGLDRDGRHHTPHSCRHTFSRLCESYGVREADRKRMLGHSFGNDITNGVYGHRSVGELRGELEKICVPHIAENTGSS